MKNYKILKNLFCISLVLFLITSCKSSKSSVGENTINTASAQKYMESVVESSPDFSFFSSKVRMTFDLDGKGLTVSGSLKIKKNDAIQLSFSPFLGIEVARIEITPEYILVIDRMNKRYVQAPISLLKELGDTDLDFYSLQALFLNKLFLRGIQNVTMQNVSAFDLIKGQGDKTYLKPKDTGNLDLSFITTTPDTRLTGCNISSENGSFLFDWRYANFEKLAGKMFPSQMTLTLKTSKNKALATFDLSKMTEGKNEVLRTEIPQKYRQMDINELIKQLLKI